ncbi:hypothetical protein I316_02771 [Kwoniella heveanensis BCC8398]|uniref:Uncharacterized protein n=1 Tax=Kwoniella heveanensis BCC8398 TaxID=1296120 RepID=A0A1B9GXF9_9TREE|nr:hypothetical protein I316_02771 [Kwoniella heveanensis BCC8398]
MSKPFVPTPNISRPGTPGSLSGVGGGAGKDDAATSMLLNNMGADRAEGRVIREERKDKEGHLSGREQVWGSLVEAVPELDQD